MTDILDYSMNMKRIDTHGHLSKMFPDIDDDIDAQIEKDNKNGPQNRYRVIAAGANALYGVKTGAFIREDNKQIILEKAKELRSRGKWEAIEHALNVSNIEKQIGFCNYDISSQPFSFDEHKGRFSYLAYIDFLVNGSGEYPSPDHPILPKTYYACICECFGKELKNLDDYCDSIEEIIKEWKTHNVVGLKTAIAYTSGLKIDSHDLNVVRAAFNKKNKMTYEDERMVCNTGLRHAFTICGKLKLPVVIHTGFQFSGHSSLTQSNPMHLHNTLIDKTFNDVQFVLLHGGNPYVGETTYLATMFPNVIIDFTWISWMTPSRFKQALIEWISIVPHDRLCWGSDSGSPEAICGIDAITRKIIGEVLEEMINECMIDKRYAKTLLEYMYFKTPKRIFNV